MSRTLYQKIVDEHTIKRIDAQTVLLYCDVHFANEYTSPQAFAGLSSENCLRRCPTLIYASSTTSFPAPMSRPGE